jgi:hypothetical protein
MKLSLLNEATGVTDIGRLVGHISQDEKVGDNLSSDLQRFDSWLRKPDPQKWDSTVSGYIERYARDLYKKAEAQGDQTTMGDARKWGQIAKLDGNTMAAAVTAAPDGVARDSMLDDSDLGDGITNPIISNLGDNAYAHIVGALSNNPNAMNRVLKLIYANLGSMKSR